MRSKRQFAIRRYCRDIKTLRMSACQRCYGLVARAPGPDVAAADWRSSLGNGVDNHAANAMTTFKGMLTQPAQAPIPGDSDAVLGREHAGLAKRVIDETMAPQVGRHGLWPGWRQFERLA